MNTLLSPSEIAAALNLSDLTYPLHGAHAMQQLLGDVVSALTCVWRCEIRTLRYRPVVPVEDNYDRLGYDRTDITRDSRYTRYVSETTMLRSHTSAGIPPTLRALATEPNTPSDVLLSLPGLAYRRDAIDRLHVGTPHQVDLWRMVCGRGVTGAELREMVTALVDAVLPGARYRLIPTSHPYTIDGYQVDVETDDGWVELAECGLAAPYVLDEAGLDTARWSGLALGMGLDRALMLRKQLPDIRLLRATDPRIATQMRDLSPWRPVSPMPPISRDLSIVTDTGVDAEILGDQARIALGEAAGLLERLEIRAITAYANLPEGARRRLGIRPDQANVLVRIVLCALDSTLTDAEANAVRDRVYLALHRGPGAELIGTAL